jgi:biopolymer transport protein ExbB
MFAALIVAALGGRIAFAAENDVSPTSGVNVEAPAADAPVDPGNDPAPAQPQAISTHNLARAMVDGGPLMLVLGFCSLLVITFVFERAINLRRSRIIPKPFVTRMLEQIADGEIDRGQALELCEQNGSPIAQVFAGAVRKWGRPSVEVEQAAIDAGERAANKLRRYLRIFYGVANVGPLLGLMGTVLGMIETFNAIAGHDALGRAEMLAGGIAKALLNTAGGLAVAIPASIFYVVFTSRIDRLVMDIDSLSQEIVNLISAEELQQRASRKPKRPSREAA